MRYYLFDYKNPSNGKLEEVTVLALNAFKAKAIARRCLNQRLHVFIYDSLLTLAATKR